MPITMAPLSMAQIKEEVVEYLKEEAEWGDSDSVSESALVELYAGHEVKDELVLGPEGLQLADIAFTLYAAQALNVKELVPRDCVVRLERVDRPELLKSKIHRNTDIATDRDTHVCDICGKRFALETQLTEHAMIHIYQSSERGVTRDVGDNRNWKNVEMETAREQKASVSRQDYSGTDADDGEMPVINHLKTADSTKDIALYKCGRCSYASASKGSLLIHEIIHTAEKVYTCNRCSYASTKKSNLLVHERKHTGEKPYKCSHCGYASATKSGLLIHETIHTGEKRYKCNRCSYASAYKRLLLDHERRKHTEDKPFKCSYCSHASALKYELVVHERTHTCEKPYKCDRCSFAGAREYDLLLHETDGHYSLEKLKASDQEAGARHAGQSRFAQHLAPQ